MSPHLAGSGSARTRFQREARAAAAITHDNVIDIYGVSESNGLPCRVMPFARGPSLQKRIDEGGPLSVTEVLRTGRQIARPRTETSMCLRSGSSESFDKFNHGEHDDTDRDPQHSMAGHSCNHRQHTAHALDLQKLLLNTFDQMMHG